MVFSSPPQRKEKKQNYLHGKAPNKQKKNEKSFWVFFLITTTTGMESKLAKSYNYFFVFLKIFQTHKNKVRKENKLAWIVQWKSMSTDN